MPLLQLAGPGLSPLSDPDPLPAAPFFERWLFQDTLPTAITLCIIGVVGWWWLQRTGKPKASWILAAAAPLLAAGVLLLGKLVVTEREALVLRVSTLVDDTIKSRPAAVAPLLRSDLTLTLLSRQTSLNRAGILKHITDDTLGKRYQAGDSYLKWATATIDSPTVARTQCRVMIKSPWADGWLPSTWMIHWARDNPASPWQVRMIDGQQIGFMPQQGISDF